MSISNYEYQVIIHYIGTNSKVHNFTTKQKAMKFRNEYIKNFPEGLITFLKIDSLTGISVEV